MEEIFRKAQKMVKDSGLKVILVKEGTKLCDECGVEVAVHHMIPTTDDGTRANGPRLPEMDMCSECAWAAFEAGTYEREEGTDVPRP